MQRTATPCTPVRFRPQPPLLTSPPEICPGGEIGNCEGLKIPNKDMYLVPHSDTVTP